MVLLCFGKFEIACQGIELVFPETAVLLNPGGGLLHRRGGEAATMHAAVNLTREKAGGLEDAQMLRDSGEGDVEGLSQLGDGGFPEGQARKDSAAGGVGEGGEGGIQRGL